MSSAFEMTISPEEVVTQAREEAPRGARRG